MSLINDALRKARQAAAEHDDRRAETGTPRAYPSRRPERRIGPAAVGLIAVLAAIGGAAAVWWVGNHETAGQPSGVAAVRNQPSTGEEILPAPAPVVVATPPPPMEAESAEVPRDSGRSTRDPEPTPATLPPDAVQSFEVPNSPPLPSNAPAPTATIAVPVSGNRVFVMDADVGYATLSLGYIVFRPVRPFAEINGEDVYEGSEIAGFTIEKIEIDRVVLRDDRGSLELRVP